MPKRPSSAATSGRSKRAKSQPSDTTTESTPLQARPVHRKAPDIVQSKPGSGSQKTIHQSSLMSFIGKQNLRKSTQQATKGKYEIYNGGPAKRGEDADARESDLLDGHGWSSDSQEVSELSEDGISDPEEHEAEESDIEVASNTVRPTATSTPKNERLRRDTLNPFVDFDPDTAAAPLNEVFESTNWGFFEIFIVVNKSEFAEADDIFSDHKPKLAGYRLASDGIPRCWYHKTSSSNHVLTRNYVLKCPHCSKHDTLKALQKRSSNLKSHAIQRHLAKWNAYCGVEIDSSSRTHTLSLQDQIQASNQGLHPAQRQQLLRTALRENEEIMNIVENIVLSSRQAFSIIDNIEFRRLIARAGYQGRIPHRQTLVKRLTRRFEKYKELLKLDLEEASHISLTHDGWKDEMGHYCLLILVSYVLFDKEKNKYERYERVLEFRRLGQHEQDSKSQAKFIFQALRRYDVSHKLFTITADNASVNVSAADDLYHLIKQQITISGDRDSEEMLRRLVYGGSVSLTRCLAHITSLVVEDFTKVMNRKTYVTESNGEIEVNDLEGLLLGEIDGVHELSIADTISKVKELVDEIRQKSGVLEAFEEFQRRNGASKVRRPITSTPTRWHSTYLMLRRAYEMRTFINDFVTRTGWVLKGASLLTNTEWGVVKHLLKVLKPFYRITQQCSSKHESVLSTGLNHIYAIDDTLLDLFEETIVKGFQRPAQAGLDTLRKYMDAYTSNRLMHLATMVDPRIKTNLIVARMIDPEQEIQRYKLKLKKYISFSIEAKTWKAKTLSTFSKLLGDRKRRRTKPVAPVPPQRPSIPNLSDDEDDDRTSSFSALSKDPKAVDYILQKSTSREERGDDNELPEDITEMSQLEEHVMNLLSEKVDREVEEYLREPVVLTKGDDGKELHPLEIWTALRPKYPLLSDFAVHYFANSIGSVNAERIFGGLRDVFSIRRRSFNESTLLMLVSLTFDDKQGFVRRDEEIIRDEFDALNHNDDPFIECGIGLVGCEAVAEIIRDDNGLFNGQVVTDGEGTMTEKEREYAEDLMM